MFLAIHNTATDWQYTTEPSPHAGLAMRNGRGKWPRGKMLGGSSSMNGMIYVRGNRRDYDGWEERGNQGWNYKSVLPYFLKSEDNLDPSFAVDKRHHATGGYLKVGNYYSDTPIIPVLKAGFRDLGYAKVKDCNADEHIGYLDLQGTLEKGVRSSSASAFLVPVKDRSNLHVIKHAHANDLLWSADDAVQGVRFQRDGQVHEVRARKEVIVSAGTVNTPQFLQLSGIGPKHQLAEHEIPLRVDLPVGENMQDHMVIMFVTAFHRSNAEPVSLQAKLTEDLLQYLTQRSGGLAHTGALTFNAFVSTINDKHYPNVQYHTVYSPRQSTILKKALFGVGFNEAVAEAMDRANEDADTVLWWMTMLRPKAKGWVRLNGTDPLQKPRIDAKYLTEEADVQVAKDGIRLLLNLTRTQTFAQHEAEAVWPPLPACDALRVDRESDEYLECYVRHMTTTLFHPVGTARMGNAAVGPEASVVDAELRVHGVRNLRVVDASVMPDIVSGNTNAATIMIAEKGADLVKQRWGWLHEEKTSRVEL